MASRNRTALDKQISRAQKNARNKLYRIRQAGAINTEEFDPRVSQQELKGMNGSQKKAYLRKLEFFNKRQNKIIVQPQNGVAIPETKLKAYRQAELEVNAARILRRAAIEESVKSAAQRDIAKIRDTVTKEIGRRERAEKLGKPYKPLKASERAMRGMPVQWSKLDVDYLARAQSYYDPVFKQLKPGERNKFQDIVPIWMREAFPSAKAVEEQTIKAKKAKERIKIAKKRYPQYRKALVEKAMFSGYPELAEAIRALTYQQLDYLHYYTDFDAWGSFFSSMGGYLRGEQAFFEDERGTTDEAAEAMMQEILRARRIRPGMSAGSAITYTEDYSGENGFANSVATNGTIGDVMRGHNRQQNRLYEYETGRRMGYVDMSNPMFAWGTTAGKESRAANAQYQQYQERIKYDVARQIRHSGAQSGEAKEAAMREAMYVAHSLGIKAPKNTGFKW